MSILVFVFNEIFHKIIELGILITVFHILYIYINRDACIYRINTDNGGFKDIYTRVKSILAVRKYFLVSSKIYSWEEHIFLFLNKIYSWLENIFLFNLSKINCRRILCKNMFSC